MIERINKLRKIMTRDGIDAFLIKSGVNRRYISNFTGTSGIVLITPQNNYFITDFRYTQQAKKEINNFEILELNNKQTEKINELLKNEEVNSLGLESKRLNYKEYTDLEKKLDINNIIASEDLVEELRLIKDESEIEKIRTAVEITDKAFNHILDYIKPGIRERDIALELEYFMKKQGAERNSFTFIVASGKRSSMPHGVASDKIVESGDFITMDFGTVYAGYCSDMTRTVVLGEATEKQENIYNIVLEAQLEVIRRVKPGMKTKELDKVARSIIADAGYREYFGHGLGHGVGLEVHENPRVSYTSDEILKPGMIITDEPGIYLPGWGGVRIEDDLLITEDGCEVFNNSPKELIKI